MDDYQNWMAGLDVDNDLPHFVNLGDGNEEAFDKDVTSEGTPKATLHGRKKVLAPYVTDLVNLRHFLQESEHSLQSAESLPMLSGLLGSRYSHGVSLPTAGENLPVNSSESTTKFNPNLPRNQSCSRLDARDQVKMHLLGLGDALLENKAFLDKMRELRNRIKKSAPKYFGKPPNLQECKHRAPNLTTLQFRSLEHSYATMNGSNLSLHCRSMYSAPYVRDTMVKRLGTRRKTNQPVSDIVLTVHIHRGKPSNHNNQVPIAKFLVLYCLGAHTLEDLANLIQCPFDSTVAKESAENNGKFFTDESWKTERLFCIEHTLFTDALDLESSRARHYQEWCEATSFSKEEMVIEPLKSRCLLDIPVRLGYPYLYKHGLAGCEHSIVFSDARLFDEEDVEPGNFPRVIMKNTFRLPACLICRRGKDKLRFHISKSERFPAAIAYVCETCNQLFNYDNNNQQWEPQAVITDCSSSQGNSNENALDGDMDDDDNGDEYDYDD
ncbi:uncharacterized protein LOC129583593 isoform X2 [Paramacrobiotus metropolitanus]|uniref:uncharacterized protein LOC129583593 isoform X2 n=1 Tax=Paramacrobiotus metropolitanus TaxID=2943436 RepID=UPI0024457542|nr:uncharacterized protein LOC129583593 isoform X2 [Paramacrobiotus metropolitanus]